MIYSVSSLLKMLSKIMAHGLPSHYVIYNTSTFFMSWQIIILFSQFGLVPNTLSDVFFNVMKYVREFFNVKIFAQVTYSGTSLSFMSKSFFPFMSINSPLLNSHGCISWVSEMATLSTWSAVSSTTPLTFNFNFTVGIIALWNCAACSSLLPIAPFSYSYLYAVTWVYHWETKKQLMERLCCI